MKTIIILSLGFLVAIMGMFLKIRNKRLNWFVLFIHLLFLVLTILAVVLSTNGWGYKGAYTERIIASIWFGTGIALFGLYRKAKVSRLLKIYSGFYFWSVPLLIIGWFIPRLHFAVAVFGLGLIIDGDFNRYPIDNSYQIQTSVQGVLAGSPTLSLVESKYLLFEKVTDNFMERLERYEAIEPLRISDDSVRIVLKSSAFVDSEIIDSTIYLPVN